MSEKHKHVLITGAAKRVGRVIALTLAKAGWDVTIHYNASQTEAQTLADEIRTLGRHAFVSQADLSNRDQTEKLIPSLQGPALTALVNNASLFEHDDKDPEGTRHDAINNLAPRLLTAAFIKQLPPDQEGSILHILDSTKQPDTMRHYAASRAALRADIPVIALALAPRVRVNALSPGMTLINARESPQHFHQRCLQTPLGRGNSPEDVASGALFLLENRSITGQIVNIDCGLHLFSS